MFLCDHVIAQSRATGLLVREDMNNRKVRELYSEYSRAYLILTHTATGQTYSLDIADAVDEIFQLSPDITVGQWMTAIGDGALPVSESIPELKSFAVKYNDVWSSGYDVQAVHPTGGADIYEDHELHDLRMTRLDTDYQQFFKNCLVTVSGLLHLVDYDQNGVVVKDGGRTAYISRDNNIGLISFREVGELTCIPIKDSLVAARSETGYREGIYVKLSEPIGKRSVMLSLGGYLYLNNQHYRVVNDDTLLIEWWAIDIFKRYVESKSLIDLSALTALINTNQNHTDAVDLELLHSDAAILTYLTLSQSFVILCDTDNLYVDKHVLEATGLPGRYYSYTRPSLPMLTSNGFLPAYTAVPERIAFTLCIPNNLVRIYAAEKTDAPDEYQNSARNTMDAKRYGSAYLLEIGTVRV